MYNYNVCRGEHDLISKNINYIAITLENGIINYIRINCNHKDLHVKCVHDNDSIILLMQQ